MKKLFLVLLLSVLPVLGFSQTNTPPEPAPIVSGEWTNIINFISSGSNWMVAPYAIYDVTSKDVGGGVGAFYLLSPLAAVGMRVDYINKEFWMASGDIQIQLPITLFGKFTAVPFGFVGLATPLSGAGDENGTAQAIYGTGLAVRVSKIIDVAADWERWTARSSHDQVRAAVVFRF